MTQARRNTKKIPGRRISPFRLRKRASERERDRGERERERDSADRLLQRHVVARVGKKVAVVEGGCFVCGRLDSRRLVLVLGDTMAMVVVGAERKRER